MFVFAAFFNNSNFTISLYSIPVNAKWTEIEKYNENGDGGGNGSSSSKWAGGNRKKIERKTNKFNDSVNKGDENFLFPTQLDKTILFIGSDIVPIWILAN